MSHPRDPKRFNLGHRTAGFVRWAPPVALLACDRALERVRSLKLPIHPNARLSESRRTIERFLKFNVQLGPGDPETARLIIESNRTAFEFYLILSELKDVTDAARIKLRKMLGGPCVPHLGRHDPARDEQAEFLAGVLLSSSGCHIDLGGADLRARLGNWRFPVAVKRITSPANFGKQLRDGRDQLREEFRRDGRPGFIVLDSSIVLVDKYCKDWGADLSSIQATIVASLADRLSLNKDTSPVLGVFGIGSSFKHFPGNTEAQLQPVVHWHKRFVTWWEPSQLKAAAQLGKALDAGLVRSLRRIGKALNRPFRGA